jgi:beta-phosphoglucomutase
MGFDDREGFREAFKAGSKSLSDTELALLISKKAEIFLKIIAEGIRPYPGVVELIANAAGKVPLSLCSGALLSDVVPILNQLGIYEKFDVIVTADDVSASKPDPSSYILAVKRLAKAFPHSSITPAECLAIEDTPAGIHSAKNAGIPVIAVTNSYPAAKLSGADNVVDSLEGLSLGELRHLTVSGHVQCV